MKRTLPVFFVLFLFTLFVFVGTSFAATLILENIGTLSLDGKTYSEWWYSGVNPIFSGTADALGEVKVTLGSTTYNAVADSAGKWSVSTTEPAGDYTVAVSSGVDTYSFTLHLGQNVPAKIGGVSPDTTGVGDSTTVPSTGSEQVVSVLFSLGVLLLASYLYFWGSRTDANTHFEKYFLDN